MTRILYGNYFLYLSILLLIIYLMIINYLNNRYGLSIQRYYIEYNLQYGGH